MRRTIALVATLGTLAACGETPTEPDPPQPLPLASTVREWIIRVIPVEGLVERELDGDRVTGTGLIEERRLVGEVGVRPPGRTSDQVYAEVYSSEDGGTYWVGAEAPDIVLVDPPVWPEELMGSSTRLRQFHMFRKAAVDASLKVVVTRVKLEALDGNGDRPSPEECPWLSGGRPIGFECEKLLSSSIDFELAAYHMSGGTSRVVERVLFDTGGLARLYGFTGEWRARAWPKGSAVEPLWTMGNFDFQVDRQGGDLVLSSPITLEIPLDSVPVGGVVALLAEVEARALSRRGRESYVGAFFRDPLAADGTVIEFEGLEPTELMDIPTPLEPTLTCGVAGTPPTGTLKFDSIEYFEPEQPGASAWITVSRTDGSDGVAAVRVLTRDFTADADEDYVPGEFLVMFADGELGTRVVEVPIVADTVIEPAEALYVDLVRIPGCGELGMPRTATINIEDDDAPPPETPTYTIGGTVVGLQGTGLVLNNRSNAVITVDSNGPWVLPREYVSGAPYEVRIDRQPSGPNQVCTVLNGDGTIADADVSDVLVECEAVAPPIDGLDPGFGSGGLVTSDLFGGARDLEVLPDGKVLVLGERALARFNEDGSPDATFATGGELALDLAGESVTMHGMAMDGTDIVVAGYTLNSAAQDWAVARVTANGALDASFGIDGWARLDFLGFPDRAFSVVVQSGGGIVVGGHAQSSGPLGRDNDFAVARFTTSGDLDPSFGTGGTALADIVGFADFGHALALQADDAVVLAGRVANGGGDDPDFGLARFDADGVLDPTFGVDGIQRLPTDEVWDQAEDVLVRPDGRIVVGGFSIPRGLTARFAVMQLDPGGELDASFGSGGVATIVISGAGDFLEALALHGDGIVAVGQSANLGPSDFAIARLQDNGAIDTDFADSGTLVVDFFGSTDVAQAVGVQPDGKIVVGGLARSGTTQGMGLLRTVVPR